MSQTTLPQCAHRLSAGFFDESIGLHFEVHHPRARPDVWAEYLDGAIEVYEKHGVGEAIHRAQLEDGDGVSHVLRGPPARREGGRWRALPRAPGPARGLRVAARDGLFLGGRLADASRSRKFLPFGVVEIKGAWSAIRGLGPHSMFRTFNRCSIYAMEWFRCEFALATVAERHIEPIVDGGGHTLGSESVPFPSEEYRTALMVWRRSRVFGVDDPRAEVPRAHRALTAVAAPSCPVASLIPYVSTASPGARSSSISPCARIAPSRSGSRPTPASRPSTAWTRSGPNSTSSARRCLPTCSPRPPASSISRGAARW